MLTKETEVDNKPKAAPLVGIVFTVLTALLVVGLLTFAGPCAPHADGSASNCVWAWRVMLGASVVLGILSIVRIFETDEGERRGLSLGAALVGAFIAAVPGGLVGLCMNASMQCNALMRPFALCLGIAIFLVGAIDLTRRLLSLRKR